MVDTAPHGLRRRCRSLVERRARRLEPRAAGRRTTARRGRGSTRGVASVGATRTARGRGSPQSRVVTQDVHRRRASSTPERSTPERSTPERGIDALDLGAHGAATPMAHLGHDR
jgi:hypothetical protein